MDTTTEDVPDGPLQWLAVVLIVALFYLALWVFLPDDAQAGECAEHVLIHEELTYAGELGRSVLWVRARHRIPVWEKRGVIGLQGDQLGELEPGDQARILERYGAMYRIRTSDGLEGWVTEANVARVRWLNVETGRSCRRRGGPS